MSTNRMKPSILNRGGRKGGSALERQFGQPRNSVGRSKKSVALSSDYGKGQEDSKEGLRCISNLGLLTLCKFSEDATLIKHTILSMLGEDSRMEEPFLLTDTGVLHKELGRLRSREREFVMKLDEEGLAAFHATPINLTDFGYYPKPEFNFRPMKKAAVKAEATVEESSECSTSVSCSRTTPFDWEKKKEEGKESILLFHTNSSRQRPPPSGQCTSSTFSLSTPVSSSVSPKTCKTDPPPLLSREESSTVSTPSSKGRRMPSLMFLKKLKAAEEKRKESGCEVMDEMPKLSSIGTSAIKKTSLQKATPIHGKITNPNSTPFSWIQKPEGLMETGTLTERLLRRRIVELEGHMKESKPEMTKLRRERDRLVQRVARYQKKFYEANICLKEKSKELYKYTNGQYELRLQRLEENNASLIKWNQELQKKCKESAALARAAEEAEDEARERVAEVLGRVISAREKGRANGNFTEKVMSCLLQLHKAGVAITKMPAVVDAVLEVAERKISDLPSRTSIERLIKRHKQMNADAARAENEERLDNDPAAIHIQQQLIDSIDYGEEILEEDLEMEEEIEVEDYEDEEDADSPFPSLPLNPSHISLSRSHGTP